MTTTAPRQTCPACAMPKPLADFERPHRPGVTRSLFRDCKGCRNLARRDEHRVRAAKVRARFAEDRVAHALRVAWMPPGACRDCGGFCGGDVEACVAAIHEELVALRPFCGDPAEAIGARPGMKALSRHNA